MTEVTDEFLEFNDRELLEVADEFGVELNPNSARAEVLMAFDEFGVTREVYDTMHPKVELVEETVETTTPVLKTRTDAPVGERVVLKMTRKNARYEIRGAVFTRENPYALVAESDVDYIIDVVGGFEVARPSEVAKYYA